LEMSLAIWRSAKVGFLGPSIGDLLKCDLGNNNI
jgi:hypothetical protein